MEQSSPLKDALHASEAFLLAGLADDSKVSPSGSMRAEAFIHTLYLRQDMCPTGWRVHSSHHDDTHRRASLHSDSHCLVLDGVPETITGCA